MKRVPTERVHELTYPLTVLVTGANSGIGLAQARAFLSKGHQVIALDHQVTSLKMLKSEMDSLWYAKTDVAKFDEVERAIQEGVAYFGKLDVVCNTAGILDNFHTLDQTSVDQWQHILSVNMSGMFYVAKAALPYLLTRPASRMINMASIAGLTAGGGGVAYTTSKHAVVGFTKQLAYDYAQTSLRVNAIAPGAIQTAMTQSDFEQDAELAHWVAEQVPLKRWAQADEVAELTLFLASDASDYMTGNVIPLDGGWLIR